MESFATVADYAERYGEPQSPERVRALLADASGALLAAYEDRYGEGYAEGRHPRFDRSAAAVCCAMVSRAVSVPEAFQGASQYQQTAGSYSASVTLANPSGDLYLGRSDLRRLGLAGTRIGSIRPAVGDGHG